MSAKVMEDLLFIFPQMYLSGEYNLFFYTSNGKTRQEHEMDERPHWGLHLQPSLRLLFLDLSIWHLGRLVLYFSWQSVLDIQRPHWCI